MKFDIVSIFLGAIITLILETIVFYFLGPHLRFSILYWMNQRSKNFKDIPIEIEFRRYSTSISNEIQLNDVKVPLMDVLMESGISTTDQGVDLSINNYAYATTIFNGNIHFAFTNFSEDILSQIVLHFNKTCNYKTFSEDVFGLVNGVRSFEDSIRTALPHGILFRDEIKCNFKNLTSLTGILKKFTDISSQNVFQYLYIKDSFNIELSSNDVILREDIDSETILLLKSLITMYY